MVKETLTVPGMTIDIPKILNTPNRILIKGKVLFDHVLDILEHFFFPLNNQYNGIG